MGLDTPSSFRGRSEQRGLGWGIPGQWLGACAESLAHSPCRRRTRAREEGLRLPAVDDARDENCAWVPAPISCSVLRLGRKERLVELTGVYARWVQLDIRPERVF